MITKHRAGSDRGRAWPAVVIIAIVAGLLAMPVAANAAALTNLSWTVSNNQVSATNVTYSYSFRTATAGTIKSVTFVVSGAAWQALRRS